MQKTAYGMRISDWSSDVCSSDLTAATRDRIVDKTKAFNKSNAAEFYETHKDVDAKYCGEKLDARREVGSTKVKLEKYIEQLRKSHPGIGYDAINDNSTVKDRKSTRLNSSH